MGKGRRRLYKLKDIENILLFFPLFFIIVLAIVSFIVSFLILDFNKNSQIKLITQKSKLQERFNKNKELQKFINDTISGVNLHFKDVEKKLMLNLHEIQGVIRGLRYSIKEIDIVDLKPFLKEISLQEGIDFVIFKKDTNEVLYGKNIIKNIQKLIFNNYNNPKSLQLTLLYITSQGKSSSFYWRDEQKQSIRINYFELNEDLGWYIGAFSTTDDLKKFTAKSFFDTIANTDEPKSRYYFYYFDYEELYFYNYFNRKKWIKYKDVVEKTDKKARSEFENFLKNRELDEFEIEDFYNFKKYGFGVGIKTKSSKLIDKFQKDKEKIIQEYKNKKSAVALIISFFTLLLIISSFAFSNFIKKIFSVYNRRFETKNMLLQKWKERYELAIIASKDGLWDINFKTGKIFFSNTWLDMLGYKRGDIASYEAWLDLIHKDDKESVIKIMQEHIEGKREHFVAEYRLRTKLNRYKWVLSRGKVFFDEEGKPERLLMMAMNIVEQKRIQKALDDTRLLVKEGDIVLFRWQNDENLTVTFVSESISKFGYTPDDLLQKSVMYADIVYKEDLQGVLKSLKESIDLKKESFSYTYRIIDKNSNLRWVFSHAIFIKDDFGNVTDLYGYIYDITAIKESELELERRVKEEVEKNILKDRLLVQQNKLAAMGEMLGAIAHQWRQPLNNISLILHFIRDNFDNKTLNQEMISRYIDKARVQIEYMSHTIDDFRNFYKPSKNREEFSIKEALNSTIEIIGAQLKKIEVRCDLEDTTLLGFENEFKQAVLNILVNAKDAIMQKRQNDKEYRGVIELNGKIVGNNYEITVYNNALPIKESIIERIFEPYFTTKFEKQGTGIGLYMTKTIIESSMLGSIEVRNKDKGVEFKIVLPIITNEKNIKDKDD